MSNIEPLANARRDWRGESWVSSNPRHKNTGIIGWRLIAVVAVLLLVAAGVL